jgi:hypothetical protein
MSLKLMRVTRPPDARTEMTVIRELTEVEELRFEQDWKHLHEYQRSRDIFPLIAKNAADVAFVAANLGAILSPVGGTHSPIAVQLAADMNRALVNFLTAMRLYLDHTETRLKRRYGKSGAPTKSFERATSREFDAHAEYRILGKLRNYVQHCGLPISVSGVDSTLSSDVGVGVVHEIAFGTHVASLLETFDSWGKAKADLIAIGGLLRPHEMVTPVNECLFRVEDEVLAAETPLLLASAERIRDLVIGIQTNESVAVVARLETKSPTQTRIQLREPPYPLLAALGVLRFEPDSRPVYLARP